VNLPTADPLVLSVGGTELQASHTTGEYIGGDCLERAAQPCDPRQRIKFEP
jgi:hypothetical protein